MKRIGLLVCMALLTLGSVTGQEFYDINTINAIEITFAESNWDYLLDNYVSAGNEERLIGSVSINGQAFDSVGVRYKGNSSYNASNVKNPLNIKLDHIIDDQKMQDYGTLKLANVYKDPSFVRETMGYEIARKYFPASQSNYAKVYINGTYLGLYTSDQDVDKYFMRSNFGSGGNARVKGEIASGVDPGSMGGVWQYFGSDSTSYFSKYALESDVGWGELIDFLDTLNNHTDEIEQVLNVDRHLWFLAFQNLLVNLDGPINNPQNYYLYQDDHGRFNPIPWDLNESFGVFSMLQTTGPLSTYQMQQLSPFVNLNQSDYPVIGKILSNEKYSKMYIAHMKVMLEEIVLSRWYHERALEIQDIIASEVSADPNKFYTYSDFLNNVNISVSSGGRPGEEVVGITQLMETRGAYLSGLSDFSSTAPEITESDNVPDELSSGSAIAFTVQVNDANLVELCYREGGSGPFTRVEMLDDGLHDDGSAGDGLYGYKGLSVSRDIQYYYYAENDDAATFLPEHAENEFFTVRTLTDVVINEFLASNNLVIADQDGEYDDCIELYNNTDAVISLVGFFLSDDGSDLTQWTFPDTAIGARSFLVVWADNDEEQNGLHANFKISASGEALYLLNQDTTIINEIIFGAQDVDVSLGRFPDGVGAFGTMLPSIGGTNTAPLTIEEEVVPTDFTLAQNFPNPFNPSTTIRYNLPKMENISLIIYDVLGRQVRTLDSGLKQAGWHEGNWDGAADTGIKVSTGVYFARLQAGNCSKTIKMMYLK